MNCWNNWRKNPVIRLPGYPPDGIWVLAAVESPCQENSCCFLSGTKISNPIHNMNTIVLALSLYQNNNYSLYLKITPIVNFCSFVFRWFLINFFSTLFKWTGDLRSCVNLQYSCWIRFAKMGDPSSQGLWNAMSCWGSANIERRAG